MAKNNDYIAVGSNGNVLYAPTGTSEPASAAASWPEGWRNLGYLSDDGVTMRWGRTVQDILVWQSRYPGRRIVTAEVAVASMVLRQWDYDTVTFGLGATVSVVSNGQFKISPPDPEDIVEWKLGIEWLDGDNVFRRIFPRGSIIDDVETQIAATLPADLPVSFSALGEAGVEPWYDLTNSLAMAATGA